MAIIHHSVEQAKYFLNQNQVIAIPTETVYGLAANAYNASAVQTVFQIKNRPNHDPLIVHTHVFEKVFDFVTNFPSKAQILAKKFWPGPLTLLLKKKNIQNLITANSPQVAVRIPNHPLALALLSQLNFPLVAPSANPFGYISPTRPQHVESQLGKYIPYILDGGLCHIGLESTIVGFQEEQPVVYRLGSISITSITKTIGPVLIKNHTQMQKAPGMDFSHYSPKKKLYVGDISMLCKKYAQYKIGVLSFKKNYTDKSIFVQKILSPSGSLTIAAKNLFHYLRLLDDSGIEMIIAEYVPNQDIGSTINDRLQRASAKSIC